MQQIRKVCFFSANLVDVRVTQFSTKELALLKFAV